MMKVRPRLTFEPRVKVLSEQQVECMLIERPEADQPMNPARRSFFRSALQGVAVGVPALCLATRSAHAAKKQHKLPQLYQGQNMALFQEILDDETAHVEILQALLVDPANTLPTRPLPAFRNLVQPDVFTFVKSAATFENTGTGTYGGALFAIQQTQEYFPVATGITTVEARHAGFLNALLDEPLVPDSAPVDTSIPQSVALSRVDPFIASLNGGTVPSFDPVNASDANNFAILDFLLLLEMVETAFYQVNVAKFFGG
jgi:hypothetical protein